MRTNIIRNAEVRSQNAELGICTAERRWFVTSITALPDKNPPAKIAMRPVQNDLKERTKRFALDIIRLCRALPRTDEARNIGRQLLRSGTSVGANYRAACRARSKAEFIAKLGIVLEESDETVFWLGLLMEAYPCSRDDLLPLAKEATELTSIFVTSLRTAKGIAS